MDGSGGDDEPDSLRRSDPGAAGPAGPIRGTLPAAAAVLAALAVAFLPGPAAGQGGADSCEAAGVHPFPPPTASPLEPHTRLAAVRVDRGARDRWVALAELGERIPFWIARGCPGGLRLAGSAAGGAFSRFDMEGNGNELIEVHYRVGLRLRARLRDVEARLEAYHVSSHLGDELVERTGRSPVSTSREGLELLLQARPAPGLRLYGGPGLLLRSTRDLARASLRGGAEWHAPAGRWGPFAPYVSAEAFAWEELGWDPMLAGEAGVAFGGRRFRLAAVAGAGPSRAEQFFRGAHETLWGLSFAVTW
jgi:hypothetical protein